MTTRRTVLKGVAAGAGLLAAPALVRAQAFPGGQTIKVVVPFAAGGTTDITGRVLADRWSQIWGTSVVVENVTGAQGNVALDRVAKSAPNGTSIVICTPSVTTNQFLYSRMPFDPEKDLAYLSQTVRIPNLLVVRNTLPVNTVPELIAYAKENKGKLNYGSPGVGSSGHLSAEIFKRAVGVEMAHVPYRGSALALNDLVAGSIDLIFENIPSCINLVRGGQIRGVAVTSAKKHPLSPEFPTVGETVPDFDVSAFFGVAVPSATPPEIKKVIEDSAVAIAKEEPVRKRLAELSAEAIGSNAAEFSAYVLSERQRWGRIIKELGIRTE
jgi:tripartite-type tricarboxylate transporter receptor subunit TctC